MLDCNHKYGTTEDTMGVIRVAHKEKTRHT
jgi:hypothetical protein